MIDSNSMNHSEPRKGFFFSISSLALLAFNCVVFGGCVAGILLNAAARNPAGALVSLIAMAASVFAAVTTVWRART